MIRIRVRGLKDLDSDVQTAERHLVDGVRDLEDRLADETAVEARKRASRDSKTGRAADTIRAMGPMVSAGDGIDYYPFFDFGGRVGRGKRVRRPFIRGGRYLMRAASEIGVIRQAEKLADDVAKDFD